MSMKFARLRAQEVLVGDVATAGHRHHAVGDEELVVHAVVEPAEVEDRRRVAAADAAAAGAAERVEEADLDVRERRPGRAAAGRSGSCRGRRRGGGRGRRARSRRAAPSAAAARSGRSRAGSTGRRARSTRAARAGAGCRASRRRAAAGERRSARATGDETLAILTSGLSGLGGSASVSVLPMLVGSEPQPAARRAATAPQRQRAGGPRRAARIARPSVVPVAVLSRKMKSAAATCRSLS